MLYVGVLDDWVWLFKSLAQQASIEQVVGWCSVRTNTVEIFPLNDVMDYGKILHRI